MESWIRGFTKESESSTSLREAHDFYKQTMFDKGESPVSMHKLNNALAEEYEKTKSNGVRVWLNMELVKQTIQTDMLGWILRYVLRSDPSSTYYIPCKVELDLPDVKEHDDSDSCDWNNGNCPIPRNHEHIE